MVLFGDGFDTRPFRLVWPTGTVVFMVALPEVHKRAEAVLAQQGAAMAAGCLLRRVNLDSGAQNRDTRFVASLLRAGYQADRLSVWCFQVMVSGNHNIIDSSFIIMNNILYNGGPFHAHVTIVPFKKQF